MIEKNEVRMGGIVRVGDAIKRVSNFDLVMVYFEDGTCEAWENVEGAPLDDEVILKNGFTNRRGKGETNYEVDSRIFIKKCDDENFYRIRCVNGDVYHFFGLVNYWHELQNALMDCAIAYDFVI